MIGSFVIVFREILEAALVIGVVAAAVKGLPHRGRWVGLGTALGVLGAVAVAAGIGAISNFAQGNGQELFAAGVLFAAGLMLAWHNIWMAQHGREITGRLQALGTNVLAGRESLFMLVGVTALAVMREGSEIALFLYGIAASGTRGAQLLGGSLLGLAAGITTGYALFAGLSRIPVARLFRVSGVVILFIAAAMIARGAQFLVQGGFLPPLVNRVWDSSAVLSGGSILGRSLSALVGYTPAPSLIQLLFWLASVVAIGGVMLIKSGQLRYARARTVAALVLALGAGAALLRPQPAHAADYQVYSPYVVLGETEAEMRSFTDWGTSDETGAQRGLKFALGRGLTNWWAIELYAEGEQEYHETLKLEEFEWENRFQLTPQGKYWVDVGVLNENEIPRFGHDPYQSAIGPTLERDFGRLSTVLDLLAVRQYGTHAEPGTQLEYRAQLEYRWRRTVSPLIEAYGGSGIEAGAFGHPRHQIGPGLTGQIALGAGRDLRYGAVALFGATRASADGTLVLRLEYEFY
ncbi:MAG: FTR1 family iron permease [Steroidobacteraceae bacterium]